MAISITDIADEIYRETAEDDSISIPSIAFWLRTNLGSLNNLLGTTFSVNSTTLELSPDIAEEEKSIFKLQYHIYFVDLKIRSNLGASAVDAVVEVSDFGTTVRRLNKNEVAKTWLQMRKQLKEQLDQEVRDYNINDFSPVQTCGDDTTYSLAGGLADSLTTDE